MNKIKINNITDKLFKKFKDLWPFELIKNNDFCSIELGIKNREIWAFPLVGGSEYIDLAIHAMEEHRKIIPAALFRCKDKIDGAFLVGYYAKKIKDEEYEHGIVIVPANRNSKEENTELLTSYCFERENLYKSIFLEEYFHQIQDFMKAYCSICKKYWIQDTKLMNTSFVERPVRNSDDNYETGAATSTWHTEVYPDFMRPISMIGDVFFDFMLCDHELISLQTEIEEDDSIWELFDEEKITNIYSLPSNTVINNNKIEIKGWCETIGYEISSRKDLEFNTLYDIAVPGLKGTIINQGFSIGWCGKVAFMGVGLDKPLYITPALLKEIPEIGDFEQVGNDNKAYWRNRDIDYRKKHIELKYDLVKVSDDLMDTKEAKYKLIKAAEIVLQSCKKPLKEVQKGINKFVFRYLKGLARGREEKRALEFLDRLNSVKICADEQEILFKIIEWARGVES